MNIALIGASGYTGAAILAELAARGHHVTALARRPEAIAALPDISARALDVNDSAALAGQLRGHDAVISAFSGHSAEDMVGAYLRGLRAIVAASKAAEAGRLLVVGGAGSLLVADGVQLIDTPDFPPQYKASAEGARQGLALLRDQAALNWTMLSPSALLAPGPRTGVFRLGGDWLLQDAEGRSAISVADFAVALVDEAEQARHPRQRFTVGY